MFLKIDFRTIERWIKVSEAIEFSHPPQIPEGIPAVLTWLFHPYELLDPSRQHVSENKVMLLTEQLESLKKDFFVKFANIHECVEKFKGYLY